MTSSDSTKAKTNTSQRILDKVLSVDPRKLSQDNRRELKLLKSCLQTFIDGYKWREYGALSSINFLEGLAKGPQWPLEHRLESMTDFEKYLKRLSLVPQQISERITLMRRAIALNRSSHSASLSRVPAMLRHWDPISYYTFPFQRRLRKTRFTEQTKVSMSARAKELMPAINQALNRLRRFLDKEYIKASRLQPGVLSLSHGVEYYEACLKWYVGYNIKATDVFDLGVKEVARITEEIKTIMRSLGYQGELKSFFKHIANIPKFYNHTREHIVKGYTTLINDVIIPSLPTLFYNVSIPPIKVVPVETDGPWGSYAQGSFYVNLMEPRKRSTFTMLPLTLHEAYPGHHFQEQYSQHWPIPAYRARPMNGRLYSVPFLFPAYTAYAEGWAMYSEYLGQEMGLYKDPYERFGRYVSEILRACRLVVDTGLHAFGWTRQRAIDFLGAYSDFPLSQVVAEIDRYITAPGQACAYKIGEIKIKQLRTKAERKLGPMFDIREFHHEVLKTGYMPLNILEEILDEWIESKLDKLPEVRRQRNSSSQLTSPFMRLSCLSSVLLYWLIYLHVVAWNSAKSLGGR